jgi:hypothetical protein
MDVDNEATELLIRMIDTSTELYEELINSSVFDPVVVEGAVEIIQRFREELESLVE